MGKVQLKLESFLFYLLVFSIPFQTRVIVKTWGPDFNEWMAAFFYFTDILIVGLIFSWLIRLWLKNGEWRFEKADWFLVLFISLSAVSLLNAGILLLGIYQLIKLIEFSFFYFYFKSNLGKVFRLKEIIFLLIASGVFQGTVALIQYVKQSSLGLKYLGESLLAPQVYGVAAFKVAGDLVMRAYGTFPHPNVLAAFLFATIFCVYFAYADRDKRHWLLPLYAIILSGFIFTYSRLIGLLWVAGVLLRMAITYAKPALRKGFLVENIRRIGYLTVATVVVLVAVYLTNTETIKARSGFSPSEEAYVLRTFYNKKAIESFSLLGYGVGNHIPWLRSELPGMPAKNYQPVHNIYLLILNETGILGLTSFLLFIVFLSIRYVKSKSFDQIFHYSAYILFSSYLVMGFFDHYLWTLQQGRLILWLLFGVLAVLGRRS